jgi:hypothetical protein
MTLSSVHYKQLKIDPLKELFLNLLKEKYSNSDIFSEIKFKEDEKSSLNIVKIH